MEKDMTHGSPWKLILTFAIPLVIGNIFQQFYNMVDSIIVGKYVGKTALAAVGSTGSLNFMIIGFGIGICSGFGIPIAQSFGAKKIKDMKCYIRHSFYLGTIITIIMTVLTVLALPSILHIMQTPADIYDQAYSYIVIIFLGLFATMIYNMLSSMLRAIGDSKTPLYFLILSSIINIVLDLLFITQFKLGASGAAYATVIAQLVSGIACFVYMKKKTDFLNFESDEKTFQKNYAMKLLHMGVPMALQFSITAIGSVVIQSAVNTLGSDVVAAVTAAIKISIMLNQPLETLGLTMATYGGQNLGAQKIKRIFKGVKVSYIMGAIYCIVALAFVYFTSDYLALLFIDASETLIISEIKQYLVINAMFYYVLSILFILRNLLQGLGYSFYAMFGGVAEMIARCLIAFCFVGTFGFQAICFANPLAWLFADIVFVSVWLIKKKELKVQIKSSIS
jgi:putative efflux protein, MATE family